MPPVSKADKSTVRKDVDFVAKDDEEQIATGIVMVPYAVDLQGDWERPETIQQFAEQFGNFEAVGEAGGGVMHAVFPDEHATLERNEVLEEATEIGGTEAPAGAWIQEWRFEDEELWELVADGILEGYSIGAVNVHWGDPMEQDDLPDEVTVPDRIDEDQLVWELVDGIIREVSAVDIPAVPDAMILETKSEADKRLSDHLGNRDGFLEEAQQRGHSESEAERLWEYLNRAVDIEGAGDPGKASFFERIGKAAFSAFPGSGSGSDDNTSSKTSEAPDRGRERGSEKEGRTLSTSNRHSLYATIDASLDILQDAGVDHGMTRFTDREDTTFDLSDHSARTWAEPEDDEDEEEDDKNAAGGDMPDDSDSTDMSNEDDPMADAPEWAKALNDRIDNLESEEKNAGAGDADDSMAGAPEWAKSLDERINEIEEKALDDDGEDKPEWAKSLEARIDAISKQTGTDTQQIGKSESEESEKGSGFTLDPRKARGN
ncbi:XkdF-like putative serine protease domain-containing protein [Natrinema soli]|uniref:XkdF-like putative serine protease domain-containing protein n=1 Tax=Natrinema soli TaxID=1930624 RepID=A0ABD5SKA1_9EURY|nr:XkdF-like putative serine protease domain-containing protein [Natrinema soli]